MRLREYLVMGACLVMSLPAWAAEGEHVSVYGGAFDVFGGSDYSSTSMGGEYRFKDQYEGIRPMVGALVNDDSGAYVYGGAAWDLPLQTAPWVVTPSVAVGAYHEGDSKDLGSALEFRSTLEVAYQFEEGNRVGLALSHISNAGLGDHNPGTETLQAVYSHPLW